MWIFVWEFFRICWFIKIVTWNSNSENFFEDIFKNFIHYTDKVQIFPSRNGNLPCRSGTRFSGFCFNFQLQHIFIEKNKRFYSPYPISGQYWNGSKFNLSVFLHLALRITEDILLTIDHSLRQFLLIKYLNNGTSYRFEIWYVGQQSDELEIRKIRLYIPLSVYRLTKISCDSLRYIKFNK